MYLTMYQNSLLNANLKPMKNTGKEQPIEVRILKLAINDGYKKGTPHGAPSQITN